MTTNKSKRFGAKSLAFSDMMKKPLLTATEELSLIKKIKEDNCEASKTKLISSHMRFVVGLAKQYQNRGLELSELVSDGSIGLIKAIEKFDPDKGYKFLTYAVWWIKEAIQTALIENRLVSIPVKKQTLIKKFRNALAKNSGDYDKTIAMVEFAEYKHDLHEILSRTETASLDAPVGEDMTLADLISADPTLIAPCEKSVEQDVRLVVSEMFPKILDERELSIIKLSHGIGCVELTNEQVGIKIGITGERVRQIRIKTYGKILKHTEARKALFAILKSD